MTSTLGKLIAGRYTVTAYCETCRHSARIDLDAMAERYGADARVIGSADTGPARIGGRALRCGISCCRSCNTSVRITPATPGGPLSR
jgi:hypothetical protein